MSRCLEPAFTKYKCVGRGCGFVGGEGSDSAGTNYTDQRTWALSNHALITYDNNYHMQSGTHCFPQAPLNVRH